MILGRFVARKFLAVVLTVSIFFAALYTLIECLEKFARHPGVSCADFMRYGLLYFGPSFVELFPLSVMLALGLFLRECLLKNYCEYLAIYAISPAHLIKIVGLISLVLAGFVALCHETVSIPAVHKLALFKRTVFKRTAESDEWFHTESTCFYVENRDGSFFGFESGDVPAIVLLKSDDKQVMQGNRYLFHEKKLESMFMQPEGLGHRKLLAQRHIEESLWNAGCEKISIRNNRLYMFFLIFYLKIIWWPIFIMGWFLCFYERKLFRWLGFFAAYAQTGIASAIVQIGLPWSVLGCFLLVMIFLSGYLIKRQA